MAPEKQTLAPFVVDTRWEPLVGERSGDLWTDDYSNVVRVLRLE
jgi:hypothetical protein